MEIRATDPNKDSYTETTSLEDTESEKEFWDNFCADENSDRIECRMYDL